MGRNALMTDAKLGAYFRGQWTAFDRFLNLLNTVDPNQHETRDDLRRALYHKVHDYRPELPEELKKKLDKLPRI
jgi:hypothetical protein